MTGGEGCMDVASVPLPLPFPFPLPPPETLGANGLLTTPEGEVWKLPKLRELWW